MVPSAAGEVGFEHEIDVSVAERRSILSVVLIGNLAILVVDHPLREVAQHEQFIRGRGIA